MFFLQRHREVLLRGKGLIKLIYTIHQQILMWHCYKKYTSKVYFIKQSLCDQNHPMDLYLKIKLKYLGCNSNVKGTKLFYKLYFFFLKNKIIGLKKYLLCLLMVVRYYKGSFMINWSFLRLYASKPKFLFGLARFYSDWQDFHPASQ